FPNVILLLYLFVHSIQQYLKPFHLSKEKLRDISRQLLLEMEKGLRKETHNDSTLQMQPTFVRTRPDGTEDGVFLGLHLIGADFRILWAKLNAKKKELILKKELFKFPKKVLRGSGEQYFDYIAECLGNFLEKYEMETKIIPLGFTLPYPFRQTRLDEGILISWVKDFHVRGVEGKDVVQLLQDAIQRRGVYKIGPVAVLNDTVGAMMSCGYEDPHCEIGLILGIGTNACYMEEMQNIELVEGDEGQMCVNMEWAAFGSDGSLNDIRTEFDLELDRLSLSPGSHPFEKMVSDLYLGELVRLILVKLLNENVLFNQKATPHLMTRWNFESEFVYELESERTEIDKVRRILKEFVLDPSEEDCLAVQHICHIVSLRSVSLYAASLTAILAKIKNNRKLTHFKVSVGVDGNVYKHHLRFQIALNTAIKLLSPDVEVTFLLSDDGGGKGAALLTAAATRLAAQRLEINKILYRFKLSQEQLNDMKQRMRKEMEMGLKAETHDMSSIAMLPSFIRTLPNGSEQGNFLALHLGDLNVRILLMHIPSQDENEIEVVNTNYSLPQEMFHATGVQLFDHVVDCINDFLQKNNIMGSLPVGFTFSFPCKQTKLDEGFLIKWTKGFKTTGCEGKDVVDLLRKAIARKNQKMHRNEKKSDTLSSTIEVRIVALINDTVGTMIACAYENPKCEVGVIIGTGTNACYMEEMRNIEMVPGDEGQMCINMEWGAFGDNGCLEDFVTSTDKQLDSYSQNPRKQTYEKMISGLYLGEIIRNILIALTEKGILFHGKVSKRLNTQDIFTLDVLSKVESDNLGLLQVRSILQNLGLESTCDDSIIVKEVCKTIINRAGHLCGVGIAAITEKIRENRGLEDLTITAGVTGDVYSLSAHFAKVVEDTVKMLAPKCAVSLQFSDDGSGKGAAFIAAVVSREQVLT
uniref:Hexokinase-2 n=1 Tax=Callorhinchus milii TaxID=7868 RepID=A0A4W3GGS6_CALMI